jgi:hypothetical protein
LLSSTFKRSDDHYGLYLYQIQAEKDSYMYLGGIGKKAIGDNTLKDSNFRIKNYRGGVLVRLRSNQLGYISTGNFRLACFDPEWIMADSNWVLQVNRIGDYHIGMRKVKDLVVIPETYRLELEEQYEAKKKQEELDALKAEQDRLDEENRIEDM